MLGSVVVLSNSDGNLVERTGQVCVFRKDFVMGKKYGFSFSWKRATGISSAKSRLSRQIGIPLTRSGRQRKAGRAAGCFIATATYGSENCEEVVFLRKFRDTVLLENFFGRIFIDFYYIVGPFFAWFVEKFPVLKKCSKYLINKIIEFIR